MGSVLAIDPLRPDAEVLAQAAGVLAAGGVVVMPTDSVYGIGCVAREGCAGHRRIFEIKRRERTQTLPWLVADASDLERYGRDLAPWAMRLAEAFWPGALTLVVAASEAVPREYVAADGTIALRVPDSAVVRALARRLGPLATTSANTHGEAAATSGAAVEARIVSEADLTLDAGPAPLAVASTIVGCAGTGPKIFRVGAIAPDDIMRVLEADGSERGANP